MRGAHLRTEFVKALLFICTVAVVADAALARPASAQGSVAYAHVRGDGTLDTANSKNVVAMGGGNGKSAGGHAFYVYWTE
jgi:hypothetical protein